MTLPTRLFIFSIMHPFRFRASHFWLMLVVYSLKIIKSLLFSTALAQQDNHDRTKYASISNYIAPTLQPKPLDPIRPQSKSPAPKRRNGPFVQKFIDAVQRDLPHANVINVISLMPLASPTKTFYISSAKPGSIHEKSMRPIFLHWTRERVLHSSHYLDRLVADEAFLGPLPWRLECTNYTCRHPIHPCLRMSCRSHCNDLHYATNQASSHYQLFLDCIITFIVVQLDYLSLSLFIFAP